jgi:hypothetical protein
MRTINLWRCRAVTLLAATGVAVLTLTAASAFARLPDDADMRVDAGPAALFATLKEVPDRSIPAAVGREITFMPTSPAGFAIDPSQVHARSVAGHDLYVAPMTDGLCVFIKDGSSVCSRDLDQIGENGLWLAVVPPVPGRIDPANPPTGLVGSGVTTIYGVVPDGVHAVVVTTATGGHVTSSVEDNAFVVVTDRPVVGVALQR